MQEDKKMKRKKSHIYSKRTNAEWMVKLCDNKCTHTYTKRNVE